MQKSIVFLSESTPTRLFRATSIARRRERGKAENDPKRKALAFRNPDGLRGAQQAVAAKLFRNCARW